MNTLMMLFCQYDSKSVIPVDVVAAEHFNLDKQVFLRKISDGSIGLPVICMEDSQKTAKVVHVKDLADYIDNRRANAQREHRQMHH